RRHAAGAAGGRRAAQRRGQDRRLGTAGETAAVVRLRAARQRPCLVRAGAEGAGGRHPGAGRGVRALVTGRRAGRRVRHDTGRLPAWHLDERLHLPRPRAGSVSGGLGPGKARARTLAAPLVRCPRPGPGFGRRPHATRRCLRRRDSPPEPDRRAAPRACAYLVAAWSSRPRRLRTVMSALVNRVSTTIPITRMTIMMEIAAVMSL